MSEEESTGGRRARLAREYVRVASVQPNGVVGPAQKEAAKDFVDLAGFDLHGDPAYFRANPWGSEVVRHAMKHSGIFRDTG